MSLQSADAQPQASAPAPSRARVAAFVDSVVTASMSSTSTPGVSVAVVRGSDTLALKGAWIMRVVFS